MKREFKIVCRVLTTESKDILTASAGPSKFGNVDNTQNTNGMEAPTRVQHSVTDFD